MKTLTLKRRAEFLYVKQGRKWFTESHILQARKRPSSTDSHTRYADIAMSRFGFTATKKLGNAVVRNRIRRQLKEAVRIILSRNQARLNLDRNYDYVLIARHGVLNRCFRDIVRDIELALLNVHSNKGANRQKNR